jgi:UDP-N-acetylglucosamine/UDP-N-acetyl-alpha-D-glucosaminouronate 4-epimerase
MGYENLNFPENSSFLVTGGAGFIGSNIVDAILKMGFYVRVLDNFSTGKRENIEHNLNNDKFELIEGDIRDLDTCYKACEGINYVLHQGALGSVPRSIADPLTSNSVNVDGFLNMMWAAKEKGVKRFVFASSSSVYGDEPNLPKYEDRVGKPLSPYAITKKINEIYAKNFQELYGLETVGLRYFNVFGKRQDPHSVYAAVIPIFVKKLLNNEQPLIHGDGLQSRDFTYIENVIEGNLKAALAKNQACGQAFNISYGGRTNLIDLYNKLCQLLNKNIKPIHGPDRLGDIKHSNADISKAAKLLNYTPSYSFEAGIELTIDWYKENLG